MDSCLTEEEQEEEEEEAPIPGPARWSPFMQSGQHEPVPPEVLAIKNPLPRNALESTSRPPGVIVPRILKRKDHDYTSSTSQPPSNASSSASPVLEDGDLPRKKLSQSTLDKMVCAVACCKAPFPSNVSFHRFPRAPALRMAWLTACKRKDNLNPDTGRVCSQHFKVEDMERDLKYELMNQERRFKLKPGAVPSVALLPSTEVRGAGIQEVPKTDRAKRAEKKEQQEIINMLADDDSDTCSVHPMEEDDDKKQDMSCQTEDTECQDKSCQTENDLVKENMALKKKIKYLETELRKARQRPQLSEKGKVAVAKEVMNKSALSKQQVIHLIDDKQRTRWKSEDIVLGLTVRGLSKKSYNFLRAKKLLPLPSLTTLRSHIRSFTCSPGIQDDILEGMSWFFFLHFKTAP